MEINRCLLTVDLFKFFSFMNTKVIKKVGLEASFLSFQVKNYGSKKIMLEGA